VRKKHGERKLNEREEGKRINELERRREEEQ
jgi:hypothetical protein